MGEWRRKKFSQMAYATGLRLLAAFCFCTVFLSPFGVWFWLKAREKEREREQQLSNVD